MGQKTNESYEDKIHDQVMKFAEGESNPLGFFYTAIDIQKHAYDLKYAKKKMEFACECLARSGFCSKETCGRCELEMEHKKAVNDISKGLRKKYKIKNLSLSEMEIEEIISLYESYLPNNHFMINVLKGALKGENV